MKKGQKILKASISPSMMEALFGLGLTNAQVAKVFDVTEHCVELWCKDEKFKEAIAQGKKISDQRVVRALFERATGYTHPEEQVFCYQGVITTHQTLKHYPPDTMACIYWLNNRDRENWKNVKASTDERAAGIPEMNIFLNLEQKVETTDERGNGNGNGKKHNGAKAGIKRFRTDGPAKFRLPDTL